jgi:hypothetical protein
MFAYDVEQDFEKDQKAKTTFEMLGYEAVDVGKEVYKTISDNAIMDTSIALAGETFGASIIVGMGVTIVNDFVADHAAIEAKKLVDETEKLAVKGIKKINKVEKSVEHTVGKSLKSIGKKFKKWF